MAIWSHSPIGCLQLTVRQLKSRWRGNNVASYWGITVFTLQYICIWAYTCQNSHWILSEYLSFSYLSPTVCRKFFLRNLKSFPSSWLAARYFFILRIVAIYIHFEIVLFIFLAEKRTHRLTKVTVCEPWLKFIV